MTTDRQERALLELTDVWAARTLNLELQNGKIFLPAGMEYEDLLVIARAAAWAGARAYNPERGSAFRSWVIGQVKHAIHEACRKRKYGGMRAGIVHRLEFVSLELMRDEDGDPIEPADPHNPYPAAEARIIADYLARVLPSRTYAIFEEYFARERTGRDVGADYGITQSRVWQIIGDGRAKAREALER
jgi:RNA polymerase sigma factor (sigma-70 family)